MGLRFSIRHNLIRTYENPEGEAYPDTATRSTMNEATAPRA